ncbi:hypothetical protein [Pedobacter metabolipauper]|uniref:Uncharacterized protein n=1 Tax=Pedobacter metabolipauper TaxID=425513 RepID=A0A4R6SQJ3_9SPHI|nr:hypothetical protein [Pedobacter metabolipauper]TDQ06409.1 hypothetical protein ATK78_4479 [Pedobacter metabolipauper]
MKIPKTLRLLLTFYSSFCLVTLSLSLTLAYAIFLFGIRTIPVLVWLKLLTTATIYYYITNYKKKEFFYYQNLGISKVSLWSCTLTFDVFLFIFLLIIGAKV